MIRWILKNGSFNSTIESSTSCLKICRVVNLSGFHLHGYLSFYHLKKIKTKNNLSKFNIKLRDAITKRNIYDDNLISQN